MRPSDLAVWSQRTRRRLHLKAVEGSINSLAFSPDGRWLACAGDAVELWDARQGRRIYSLTDQTAYAKSVAYTPDGNGIVTGGDYDGRLKWWDPATGQLRHSVRAHKRTIDAIAFSRDGTRYATASWDGAARVWNARNGKLLHTLSGHSSNVWSVVFSPDGRYIATGGGEIKIWSVASGRCLRTFPDDGMDVAFVDARTVLTDGPDKAVHVRSIQEATGRREPDRAEQIGRLGEVVAQRTAIRISPGPNGRLLRHVARGKRSS